MVTSGEGGDEASGGGKPRDSGGGEGPGGTFWCGEATSVPLVVAAPES